MLGGRGKGRYHPKKGPNTSLVLVKSQRQSKGKGGRKVKLSFLGEKKKTTEDYAHIEIQIERNSNLRTLTWRGERRKRGKEERCLSCTGKGGGLISSASGPGSRL